MTKRPTDEQQTLPYAEAEGTFAEKQATIRLAIACVQGSLHLRELMMRVAAVIQKNHEPFVKSWAEIAATPEGLCCSPKTAQRTVYEAVGHGWLALQPTFNKDGGLDRNAITINWEGLRRTINHTGQPFARRERRSEAAPQVNLTSGHGQSVHTYGQSDHTCGQIDQSLKEYSPSSSLSSSPLNSPPSAAPSLTGASHAAWTAAAEELREAGAGNAAEIVARLRGEGRSIAEAREIARTLRANRGAFKSPSGAAWFYVVNGRWPVNELADPADVERKAALAAEAQAEREQRLAELRRREADERRRDDEIRARFGPALDATSDAERDELAVRTFQPIMLEAYRRGSPFLAFELRFALMKQLAAEADAAHAPQLTEVP